MLPEPSVHLRICAAAGAATSATSAANPAAFHGIDMRARPGCHEEAMIPTLRPRPVDVSAVPEPALIAEATLEGFNRHYALFRDCASAAKSHFEAGNWLAIAHTSQDRIDFYDRRVAETVMRLEREFGCDRIDEARWEAVKRLYIGLLID